MSGQSSGVQGASNSCPGTGDDLPTVSITATDPGFRTMKVTWGWSGTAPALTALSIKYLRKTGCAPPSNPCVTQSAAADLSKPSNHVLKGIGGDAGYDIWIEAAANINSVSTTITSARVSATTFDPISMNPKVVKQDDASIRVADQEALADFLWGVFTSADVEMNAVIPSEYDSRRFTYKVSVPKASGLQLANASNPACVWETASNRADWRAEDQTWTRTYAKFHLVRCGVGDGSSVLAITARDTLHDYERTLYSLTVKKSWHDADHRVLYQIDCANTPSDIDYVAAVTIAAAAWNGKNTGVTFARKAQDGCTLHSETGLVTVKDYIAPANPTHDICLQGIACVQQQGDSVAAYPHIVTQHLLIKRTPQSDATWSNDEDGDGIIMRSEIYLPMTLIHELGHAGGLGHSADSDDSMHKSTLRGTVDRSPHPNDITAMKSIYKNHTSH